MSKGKVSIFMGEGHGKSAAALGNALQRACDGDRVVIIQFLKVSGIAKSEFTKRLEPELKIFRFEKSSEDYLMRSEEERREDEINIHNGLNFAKKVLVTGECDLLILDEVLELINNGIIGVDELKELTSKNDETDIIITGCKMDVGVCEFADEVSEITNMYFKSF